MKKTKRTDGASSLHKNWMESFSASDMGYSGCPTVYSDGDFPAGVLIFSLDFPKDGTPFHAQVFNSEDDYGTDKGYKMFAKMSDALGYLAANGVDIDAGALRQFADYVKSKFPTVKIEVSKRQVQKAALEQASSLFKPFVVANESKPRVVESDLKVGDRVQHVEDPEMKGTVTGFASQGEMTVVLVKWDDLDEVEGEFSSTIKKVTESRSLRTEGGPYCLYDRQSGQVVKDNLSYEEAEQEKAKSENSGLVIVLKAAADLGSSWTESSLKARVIEDKVDRLTAIMSLGDCLSVGMGGCEAIKNRLTQLLKLRGHVGVSFEDAYAALNVLSDDDLTDLYNFALTNGMPDLGLTPPTAASDDAAIKVSEAVG